MPAVRGRCLAELVGAAAMAMVSTAGLVPLIASSPVIRDAGVNVAWAVPAGGSFVIVVTGFACALCCMRLARGRWTMRPAPARAEGLLLLTGPVALAGAGLLTFLQTMVPLLRATLVMG